MRSTHSSLCLRFWLAERYLGGPDCGHYTVKDWILIKVKVMQLPAWRSRIIIYREVIGHTKIKCEGNVLKFPPILDWIKLKYCTSEAAYLFSSIFFFKICLPNNHFGVFELFFLWNLVGLMIGWLVGRLVSFQLVDRSASQLVSHSTFWLISQLVECVLTHKDSFQWAVNHQSFSQ